MNVWLAAGLALLLGLAPCGWVVHRKPAIDGLVALQLGASLTISALLVLSEGIQQPSLVDLALALALTSFGGGLVYARFLERWV